MRLTVPLDVHDYMKKHTKKIILYSIIAIIMLVICLAFIHLLSLSINAELVLRVVSFRKLYILSCVFVFSTTILIFFITEKPIKNKLKFIFYSIMISVIILMVVLGYLTHGETIRSLVHPDKNDVFMDYFNSIQYGLNPYSQKVIYPPLINVIYGFLGRFALKNVTPHALRTNPLAAMTFVIYNLFSYLLLFFSLHKLAIVNKISKCEINALTTIFMFTVPFIFMLERANSVIMALTGIIVFYTYYRDKNINKRIIGMLAIAIAASIKIVPAIFGVLLMREKRWKDGILTFIIGVLVFYLPFFLTDGNLHMLLDNIKNTTALQGFIINEYGNPLAIGHGCYVNLDSTIKYYSMLFNYDLDTFIVGIKLFLLLSSLYIILFKKNVEQWKVLTLLCGIMVLIPGFSSIYNLIFYILPLIIFLNDTDKFEKKNVLYLLLFILIFLPVVNIKLPLLERIFGNDYYRLTISTVLESTSIFFLSSTIVFETIFSSITSRREKLLFLVLMVSIISFGCYQRSNIIEINSFTPLSTNVGRGVRGIELSNGRYSYLKEQAVIYLNAEQIRKDGLIVSYNIANEAIPQGSISFTLNGKSIATKNITNHKSQGILISAKNIRDILTNKSGKVKLEIQTQNFNDKVFLDYIGPIKPLSAFQTNKYYSSNSIGIEKNLQKGVFLLENNVICLRDNNIGEKGMMCILDIPRELFKNTKEPIEIQLLVAKKNVKNVNVDQAGRCLIFISPYEFGRAGINSNDLLEINIKSSRVYDDTVGRNLNRDKKICLLEYLGAIFPIINKHEIIYDAAKIKYDGLLLTYKNQNNKRVWNTLLHTKKFLSKTIENEYSYCYIPAKEFSGTSGFVKLNFSSDNYNSVNINAIDLLNPRITLIDVPEQSVRERISEYPNGLIGYKDKRYLNYRVRYLASNRIKQKGIKMKLFSPNEYSGKQVEIWYNKKMVGTFILENGANDIILTGDIFAGVKTEELLNLLEIRTNITFDVVRFTGVEVQQLE